MNIELRGRLVKVHSAVRHRITGERFRKLLMTILIGIIALIFVFPIILTVTNSFMGEGEITRNYSYVSGGEQQDSILKSDNKFISLKVIPEQVQIKQYYTVLLKRISFLMMFWNSVRIVLPIIIGQIIVACMAAYAFGKIQFRGREILFMVYIVTMLMPFQVTLVPNYIIANKLGLIGSYLSIIFPGIFSTFGVFLLRQFMVYIPNEYVEAARVDGATHFDIFFRIIIPMSKTGIAALAILVFIDNWNMVEQPIVFLQDSKKQPLSVFLTQINAGEMGVAFAASTLYMLPIILVFMYAENYFIQGIQLSGIKG